MVEYHWEFQNLNIEILCHIGPHADIIYYILTCVIILLTLTYDLQISSISQPKTNAPPKSLFFSAMRRLLWCVLALAAGVSAEDYALHEWLGEQRRSRLNWARQLWSEIRVMLVMTGYNWPFMS